MIDNTTSIAVKNLKKSFRLPHEQHNGIKQLIINRIKGIKGYEKQQVLKDINFEIRKGEFFGIVGCNGSGKSTLLKLISGIYTPDNGSIHVEGTLTPFIELGVGFNPELTGRENVFLNGALLGFDNKQISEMYEDIVHFSELSNFMDQKLKNYSSGMQVRLAFSIAIRSRSDILILDEVLAVGDASFQKKCFEVFKNLKKEGRTIVLVTHDMNAVVNFCDRAILLSEGRIYAEGKPLEVSRLYGRLNSKKINDTVSTRKNMSPVEIKKITISGSGNANENFIKPSETITINLSCRVYSDAEEPIIGISLSRSDGLRLYDTNTSVHKVKIGRLKKGELFTVCFKIENIISDGKYIIDAAVADKEGVIFASKKDTSAEFIVSGWDYPSAIIQPKSRIEILSRIKNAR